MRKCIFYRVRALKKATQCIEKNYKRTEMIRLNITSKDKNAKKQIRFKSSQHSTAIKAKQLTYKFDISYFPEGWLTFICGAHPKLLESHSVLKCFRNVEEVNNIPGLDAIAQMAKYDQKLMPPKVTRKQQAEGDRLGSSTSSLSTNLEKRIVHVIEHFSSDSDVRQRYNDWAEKILHHYEQLENHNAPEHKKILLNKMINNAEKAMRALESEHSYLLEE